jgi:hypothetical protein
MEAALWKSIPVKSPEQLRLFSWVSGPEALMDNVWGSAGRTPSGGRTSTVFSYAVFQELQRPNAVFDSLFAFKPVGRILLLLTGNQNLSAANWFPETSSPALVFLHPRVDLLGSPMTPGARRERSRFSVIATGRAALPVTLPRSASKLV